MRDFPPLVADLEASPTPGHHGPQLRGRTRAPRPGTFADPDTRSPARFLGWLLAQQRLVLFVSAVTAVAGVGAGRDRPVRDRPDRRRGHHRPRPRPGGRARPDPVRPGAGRRDRRRAQPHRGRPLLADRDVRPDDDGQPQVGAAGPRAAAADADRRGAECRGRRRRRVRRPDRDLRPVVRRAGVVPGDRRPGAVHLGAPRGDGAGRRAADRGARPAAAAPAAAPRGGGADPVGRPDRDGDRHRGRAADPARHRRRAHLRPQLRRPVAADPAGRRRGRRLAGPGRVGQRAVLRAVPGGAHLAGRPRGGRRAAQRRRADQLLRLRAVHGLADPDLLRAGPALGPLDRLGPQGRSRCCPASPRGIRRSSRCGCPRRACCTTSGRASPRSRAS